MKKVFSCLILLIILFFITSCDEFLIGEQKQHEIYLLAVEAGYTGTYEEWLDSIKGEKGEDGVSIVSITKESSVDLVDTYVIIFSNGTSSKFTVTNGKDATCENGLSAFDIYLKYHPTFDKTEEEWINMLINGELENKTSYTVNFYVDDVIVEKILVKKGNLLTKIENPSKENHSFIGWFTDDNDKWNFYSDCIYSDLNLYAKFEYDYEIKFVEKVTYEKKLICNLSSEFNFTDKLTIYGTEKDKYSGSEYNSTYFKASNFVNIEEYQGMTISITVPIYTLVSGGRAPYCLCFYDKNQKSINKGYQFQLGKNSVELIDIVIPLNASYIRTSYYMDSFTNYENSPTSFSCEIYQIDKIISQIPISEASNEDIIEKSNSMRILNQNILCDGFALTSDGLYLVDSRFSITSYIECKGAKSLNISMMQTNNSNNYGLAFYDESKRLISFINSYKSFVNSYLIKNYDIPSDAYYFKTTYYNSSDTVNYNEFICELIYENDTVLSKYNSYQNEMIFFSQSINQNIDFYENDNYIENDTDYKNTTGVIYLPKNYSEDGEKSPVILFFHGLSHYVYYGKFGNSDSFLKQKEHWHDKGFVVVGCNGARDNSMNGSFRSAAPQFVEAYKKCLEYVISNYNVEDEVYVVAASAGGPCAINFCYEYEKVKALVLLSTWTDIYECQWKQNDRATFVEYLGFESTSKYENNIADKYNPAKHIKTDEEGNEYIDDLNIPVIAFIGEKETGGIIDNNLRKYINALNNYNQNTSLVVFDNLEHSEVCSGGVEEVDNAVIEFFLKNK